MMAQLAQGLKARIYRYEKYAGEMTLGQNGPLCKIGPFFQPVCRDSTCE